ncbi:MAG: hypothetical protein LBL70_06335, partial [Treponema sp.]|nr:hypothetical protein [Treponema sp.]
MKEAYMREGPDHTDDRMIMNVARVCAGCSRAYPTEPCRTCSFNPAQYTDAKRANLMRANAQIGFDERPLQREHLANSISTGITFMLLVLSFVLIIAVPQCSKRAQTSPWERKVETAIRLTHENIRDVSQDGLVNCQDYAVLFEHYFTGASIIFNPM